MAEKVTGKVIVITGGSSGIGACVAQMLAKGGARVAIAARRTDRLSEVRDEIVRSGGDSIAVECDVSQRGDVERLARATMNTFGCIDVWVNNAGIFRSGPMSSSAIEDWEQMVDVNIKGVLYGIGTALPIMENQGFGHIINVGSIGGHKVFGDYAVYCGTKHAVRAISEGLQLSTQGNVRVTHIAPGGVSTEMFSPGESEVAMTPRAVAKAIAFAIGQPADIGVNEIVVRPRGAAA